MKTLNPIARVLAAAAAATATTVMFAGVVAIAEPQRSELIAKHAGQQRLTAAPAAAPAAQQIAQAR